MSGGNVPYQLRTNKYVERQLFLDLLNFVRSWDEPASYVYASMGGRFLEDFRFVHQRFELARMVSIESDVIVHQRQLFNNPWPLLECRHQTSGDFVVNFDHLQDEFQDSKFVVWFDFATANERGEQVQEFASLVKKLNVGDVAKITLNANPQSVSGTPGLRSNEQWATETLEKLNNQFANYPDRISAEDLTLDAFPKALGRVLQEALLSELNDATGRVPQPLAFFRYNDQRHQMLTATILVADEELATTVKEDASFQMWPFRATTWEDVHEIRVPDVSLRERIEINRLLDQGGPAIHGGLGFRFAEDAAESLSLLEMYLLHYRRYPNFLPTLH